MNRKAKSLSRTLNSYIANAAARHNQLCIEGWAPLYYGSSLAERAGQLLRDDLTGSYWAPRWAATWLNTHPLYLDMHNVIVTWLSSGTLHEPPSISWETCARAARAAEMLLVNAAKENDS